MRVSTTAILLLTIGLLLGSYAGPHAQRAPMPTAIVPQGAAELRLWDSTVDRMIRTGGLVRRRVQPDTLLPGRTHERLDQYYKGLRVFGAELTRETEAGLTQSLFGQLSEGLDLDPAPRLSADEALAAARDATGDDLVLTKAAELLIVPSGLTFALAYRLSAASDSRSADFFVDAQSGAMLLAVSNIHTVSAVGVGTGVLGDTKKVSDSSTGSGFSAVDALRPPSIRTYDMRGNLSRVKQFQQRSIFLTDADLASTSTSNAWTDPATVDAHAYAGLVYDFYFRRFGRLGLDNNNYPMVSLVHPALRSTALFATRADLEDYYCQAYWNSTVTAMVYGDGLTSNFFTTGQACNFTSGALDVVAHELTHGVTQFSSNLIYMNESGALNESFSDIMGVSAKFFYHAPGNGLLQASYVVGADILGPGPNVPAGFRSMANPGLYGDPDHYSRRAPGCTVRCDLNDGGGVHANSGIPNNAFYLAVEGGVNQTSGLSVQGVGSGNREQIEKVFYRAFAFMLPSGATFSLARSTTIQAARDLYGAGSAAERAVTQAWTAVGVN